MIASARRRSTAGSSALAAPKGSSFNARYPRCTTRFARPRDGAWLALGLIPPIGVRRHAIAEPPAEQLPDRHTERLPHQIPARDVERGERRLRHLAGASVLGALHVPREPLDVERIGTDDVPWRQLADAGDQRVGLVDHSHFADAGQAVVGDELEEHELAPGSADHRHAQIDDLHGRVRLRREREYGRERIDTEKQSNGGTLWGSILVPSFLCVNPLPPSPPLSDQGCNANAYNVSPAPTTMCWRPSSR